MFRFTFPLPAGSRDHLHLWPGLLLIDLLPCVAGAATLPGFSLAAESTHFRFYVRGKVRPDPEGSEKHLARIESLLGHRLTKRVGVYIYGDASEIAAATGTYAGGMSY